MKRYGCANARSLCPAWALEEANAEYDYVRIDLFKGEQLPLPPGSARTGSSANSPKPGLLRRGATPSSSTKAGPALPLT